eukprot:TRINITY_DN4992_c0_g1_i3.p3 TRINITY_DN4992_c0_g1~~TRINITY_DN4992_c0_g1_i3.p3  ORF type:complete len:129 (-),score=34.09 TRINITY_DN4992_c0_g1_i3:122-508(-)
MSKKAIQVLYNVTSLGPIRKCTYMSAITIEQKIVRLKIIQWGGLVALAYIDRSCKIKPVKSLCETLDLRRLIKGKKLRAVVESIRLHMKKTASCDSIKPEEIKIESNKHNTRRAKEIIIHKSEIAFPK